MAKPKKKSDSYSKDKALQVLKIGIVYVIAYMLSIIAMDAWNLITEEATGWRWAAAIMLLIVNIGVWYSVKINGTLRHQRMLVMSLVVAQIIFAGLNIYWQRGMASVSVIMFVVPILISAALANRKYLYSTATISALVYSITIYRYFYDFYGEGYAVQLWVSVGFFSILFLLIARLIDIVSGLARK